MASVSKTTAALFADLAAYAANLGDVPYDKLLSTAAEAGWTYRLTQRELVTPPGGGTLLTFDVHVGRDGALEFFDSVSIGIPPNNGLYPVSLIARAQIIPTLIHLFFNRLPPLAAQPPKPMTVDTTDTTGDIVLPGENSSDEPARLEVIARREPDGVPIFRDLYAMGEPTNEVIDAVLDELDDFLQRASSVEQIDAMGRKNPGVISFVKDLGKQADVDDFMRMVNERRNVLAPPQLTATAPRRRGTAGRSVN